MKSLLPVLFKETCCSFHIKNTTKENDTFLSLSQTFGIINTTLCNIGSLGPFHPFKTSSVGTDRFALHVCDDGITLVHKQ